MIRMKTPEEIINYMAYEMPVMKYYDNPEPKTETLKKKRQDMIDNKDGKYIATEKHDGDFGLFAHFSKGNNLIRSRSISVKTGQYGDLTAKLPHLAAEMDEWPDNSVVLAEICWEQYGTNANTVGTILRCLPPKAVERQKENKLYGLVFDMLMWNSEDLTSTPYIDRLEHIDSEFGADKSYLSYYFKATDIFFDNFAEEADRIISAGGEGLVIQLKSNKYAPGTRTAWNTLKMKQSLPHMDLKVVSTIEPNKLYDGDLPETWKFTIDGVAVTKPYYMGWKNGVNVDFNGVTVSVTSGLTDEDREWLATEAAQEMIKNGELFAEVKAMSINSQNSLRHPCLVRLRNDIVKD